MPYQTTPTPTDRTPSGIPYIIGNEAAERFSFYGMRAILVVFMTQYMRNHAGELATVSEEQAKVYYHAFLVGVYAFPLLGALLCDLFLGKYRTIIFLSIVYCLGHLALAVDETIWGLTIGLILISTGAGGVKPCVSAHVGDQFGPKNAHLLARAFGWFYFSINLGAVTSQMLTPVLLTTFGSQVAFGVPGVLMFLATLLFWSGRHKFVHVPAGGVLAVRDAFSPQGVRSLLSLAVVFGLVTVFWSLYDQTGSAWVLQATRMDRQLVIEWLPSQVGAANPFLILLFVPLFDYALFPLANRFVTVTPLRRISLGMFITVAAFTVSAVVESRINGGRLLGPLPSSAGYFHPSNLLDAGGEQGAGGVWLSERQPKFPIDIALDLREQRAWRISTLRLRLPKTLDDTADPTSGEPIGAACRAARVELLGGPTRKVDVQTALATLDVSRDDEAPEVAFAPVELRYLTLRVHANHGGAYAALGEIEVHAEAASPPGGAAGELARVWPNVAAAGKRPNIVWQFFAFALLTAAEVLVSVTCLEFAYTQTPKTLKSIVMSFYLLSISAGNLLTLLVNYFIQDASGESRLTGASYYWFFVGLMAVGAVCFSIAAQFYRSPTDGAVKP